MSELLLIGIIVILIILSVNVKVLAEQMDDWESIMAILAKNLSDIDNKLNKRKR